jgi:DNA-binding CsgD family transcriptional regulator
MLAARDDLETASACLNRALEAYRLSGAERDSARVQRRLARGAGWERQRQRRRPVSGWASLTDSERRVAVAVSDGLTNARAADRLYLSRHTVDSHLRQIFRKLTIHSRVELVHVVVEHGGSPGPGGHLQRVAG